MRGYNKSTDPEGAGGEEGASTDRLPELTCQGTERNQAKASQSALHLYEVTIQMQTPVLPITAGGAVLQAVCTSLVGHSAGPQTCFLTLAESSEDPHEYCVWLLGLCGAGVTRQAEWHRRRNPKI